MENTHKRHAPHCHLLPITIIIAITASQALAPAAASAGLVLSNNFLITPFDKPATTTSLKFDVAPPCDTAAGSLGVKDSSAEGHGKHCEPDHHQLRRPPFMMRTLDGSAPVNSESDLSGGGRRGRRSRKLGAAMFMSVLPRGSMTPSGPSKGTNSLKG